jgi:uncharacterized hydrophobic protein (TIGR00271 family)
MTTPAANPAKGTLRDHVEPRPTGGVWGVRDYHTILEQRAVAGATMTGGYLAMVVVATVMATAGLLLNSSAAVIGAMCVAPFMAPSRAVCIGLLFGNRRVFLGGLIKQLLGLLVIGASLAALITWVLTRSVAGIGITPEILLRAMPTTRDVVLSALIAVSAGAAASLALVTQPHIVETPWGQVIDAIIGVEIAISLVPPAAVIGIGLALGTPEHSRHAFNLLLLNVVALDLVGSSVILALGGVRRAHLLLEKRIRATVATTLDVVPGFTAVDSTVHVSLLSNHDAVVEVILRRQFGGRVPPTLADQIAADVAATAGCRSNVTVEVVPLLVHTAIPV